MVQKFNRALPVFLVVCLLFSPRAFSVPPAAEEAAADQMSWDELESRYPSSSQPGPAAEDPEILKRRELEKQLSAQFASLSRGLSNMPAPPDVRNKEISFGSSASSKRK